MAENGNGKRVFRIVTLDNISVAGLERLPRDRYEVASELGSPDAILVRSRDLHRMEIPPTVKAIARAGAGVNNIPVAEMTRRGIPVFNAPGANANAVKELVLAGMLVAARNVCQAWDYVRGLQGDDEAIHREVEANKRRFRGFELPGRTLGVIGLGAIGVKVANAALALGMRVIGYDPDITVERAWQLSSEVEQGASVDDLLARVDFVTLHVPLTEQTRRMAFRRCRCRAPANANVPDMLGQISHKLGRAGLNIVHMVNESRGEVAYTLVDVDEPAPPEVIERLRAIDGVLAVRAL